MLISDLWPKTQPRRYRASDWTQTAVDERDWERYLSARAAGHRYGIVSTNLSPREHELQSAAAERFAALNLGAEYRRGEGLDPGWDFELRDGRRVDVKWAGGESSHRYMLVTINHPSDPQRALAADLYVAVWGMAGSMVLWGYELREVLAERGQRVSPWTAPAYWAHRDRLRPIADLRRVQGLPVLDRDAPMLDLDLRLSRTLLPGDDDCAP